MQIQKKDVIYGCKWVGGGGVGGLGTNKQQLEKKSVSYWFHGTENCGYKSWFIQSCLPTKHIVSVLLGAWGIWEGMGRPLSFACNT
jgi:hypothetical protein